LKASVGDIPLIVEVDFEKFKKSLDQHRLSGGVFYRVKKVPNIDMANRYMEKVRFLSLVKETLYPDIAYARNLE